MNNNKNKSPVPLVEYMSNTTHKKEERRFQEERRDVMKMDRFFTGLVALVAGLALSAGSAYATKGYLMGDSAPSKLVPHYEIGDTKQTIIGVQNMMSGDNDKIECANDANDAVATDLPNACLLDTDDNPATDPVAPTAGATGNLAQANAQANMDDAKNLIVTATAYGPSGKMQATKDICLAQGAFGYFVLGKMDMGMEMGPNAAMFSMGDGTFGTDGTMTTTNDDGTTTTGPMYVDYGYVTLVASDRVRHCDGRRTPSDEAVKIVVPNSEAASTRIVNPAIAAWTIVQDIGGAFFGVEVPTATVTMNRGENMTIVGDGMLDCYDTTPTDTDDSAEDSEFDQMKCGLIPERHNNDMLTAAEATATGADVAGADDAEGDPDTRTTGGNATPLAMAQVRYDVNMMAASTKVFVWLGTAEEGRMLDVTVHCEEGMSSGIDNPADDAMAMLSMASIAMPGQHLMLDPSMDELGDFTAECMGSRGVLAIKMPHGSHAGMAWSHVSLDGATYRMNFPGYSMASDQSCRSTAGTDDNDNDDKAAQDMCM